MPEEKPPATAAEAVTTLSKRVASLRTILIAAATLISLGFAAALYVGRLAHAEDLDSVAERVGIIESQHKDENGWHERMEKKIDWILMHLNPQNGPAVAPPERNLP